MDKNFGIYRVKVYIYLKSKRISLFGKVEAQESETTVVWGRDFKARSFDEADRHGWELVEWWKEHYKKYAMAETVTKLLWVCPHDSYIKGDITEEIRRKITSITFAVSVESFRPFCEMKMDEIMKEMTGEEFEREFSMKKMEG